MLYILNHLQPSEILEADEQKDSEMTFLEGRSESCSSATPELSKAPPVTCLTQRAALLKSMLNFLKKAINNENNNDVRHLMEGWLFILFL